MAIHDADAIVAVAVGCQDLWLRSGLLDATWPAEGQLGLYCTAPGEQNHAESGETVAAGWHFAA